MGQGARKMKLFAKAGVIRVGVVGYGGASNMGRNHLNEMARAGMSPVAVCEIDASRLDAARKEFPGIETFFTVGDMLKKSSAGLIVLITPHNTHADLALQCLESGRHVVVEKPMAITTEECDRMIAAARQKKVVLSTYHNRHWDSIILGGLRHLKAGAIGDVVRVDVEMAGWGKPHDWWRSSRSVSGGLLYDWGVHLLEYTLQIVQSDIVEVSGYSWSGVWADQTKWKNDTIGDEGYLVVRYASGAWSTLRISSCEERPNPNLIKVLGVKGTLVLNWVGRLSRCRQCLPGICVACRGVAGARFPRPGHSRRGRKGHQHRPPPVRAAMGQGLGQDRGRNRQRRLEPGSANLPARRGSAPRIPSRASPPRGGAGVGGDTRERREGGESEGTGAGSGRIIRGVRPEMTGPAIRLQEAS